VPRPITCSVPSSAKTCPALIPFMTVRVARSLLPLLGTTVITGSVARSVATSPVVHDPSDDGGASWSDARPPLEGESDEGIADGTGALGAASGVDADGPAAGAGSGTAWIFCVLNGSFIGRQKVSAGRLPAGCELPTG